MDDINKRIVELMVKSGHSKSTFAKELDVSLPLITHITSGRNKAGVELIQRILQQFTDISPDWLLNGIGEMQRAKAKEIDLSAVQARLTRLKTFTDTPTDILNTVIQYHKMLMDELLHLQEIAVLVDTSKTELKQLRKEIDYIKSDIESELNK